MTTPLRQDNVCFIHNINVETTPNDENGCLSEETLDKGLLFLKEHNADLQYGDIIVFDNVAGYRNDGKAIFDGTKLVDLYSDIDEYGSLHPQFRVIEDGTPISYWRDAIDHNYYVWFNHRSVKDQLVNNIKYDTIINTRKGFFTTFEYNGKQYRIVYNGLDDYDFDDYETLEFNDSNDQTRCLDKFKQYLNSDKLLYFECVDPEYFDFEQDDTLFLCVQYHQYDEDDYNEDITSSIVTKLNFGDTFDQKIIDCIPNV